MADFTLPTRKSVTSLYADMRGPSPRSRLPS